MDKNYTFDSDVVSDLHKDAFGFRPDSTFWHNWKQSTDDEKQATWDWLLETLKVELAHERQRKERAIQQFEQLVSKGLAAGASDRETAVRWIMQAAGCMGDWDYLCYYYDLPYNYFNKGSNNG